MPWFQGTLYIAVQYDVEAPSLAVAEKLIVESYSKTEMVCPEGVDTASMNYEELIWAHQDADEEEAGNDEL